MQFFSLLLLFIQSVTSTLTSDIWYRNPNLTHYTVYPIDPGNATKIAETETLLKNLNSDADVIPKQGQDGFAIWSITSKHRDLQNAISALDGVSHVEHEDIRLEDQSTTAKLSELVRRDVVKYMASANESSDAQKTEEFLKTIIQSNTEFYQFLDDDGTILGWGDLALDSNGRQSVEDYEGIDAPLAIDEVEEDRVLPTKDLSQFSQKRSELFEDEKALFARAGTWQKQEKADRALVMDSQYPGLDISKLADFVHVPDPGKDTFMYVIDKGVNLKVQNPDGAPEFNSDNGKVLQTRRSKDAGLKEEDDDSPSSHGTLVASKAAGRRYGVAKQAKIIPVKIEYKEEEFKNAIDLIVEDLKANPDRQHRSVVIMSLGFGHVQGLARQRAFKNGRLAKRAWLAPVQELFDLGVPLVLSAGNHAETLGRKEIDNMPKIFQDKDTPLINVGAANFDGERGGFSQYGQYLTLYAPGVDIEGMTREDKKAQDKPVQGTSVAAPQVAGLLATYMSYDTKPWDDTLYGVERVKAIRDYLLTDDSSWERKKGSGVRMIWNGAKEEDHKSAGANGLSNPPPPSNPPVLSPPTQALSIILQNYIDDASNENSWLFFLTSVGISVLCNNDKDAISKVEAVGDPAMVNNPSWPSHPDSGGTFALPLKIDGQDCSYLNDGSNPGSLWCGTREIKCQQDDLRYSGKAEECESGLWSISQHPVAFCEW